VPLVGVTIVWSAVVALARQLTGRAASAARGGARPGTGGLGARRRSPSRGPAVFADMATPQLVEAARGTWLPIGPAGSRRRRRSWALQGRVVPRASVCIAVRRPSCARIGGIE
jgi:hypothetical protein